MERGREKEADRQDKQTETEIQAGRQAGRQEDQKQKPKQRPSDTEEYEYGITVSVWDCWFSLGARARFRACFAGLWMRNGC